MPRYPLMQYMINVSCIYMWLMPSPVAFTVVSYVMFLCAVCTQVYFTLFLLWFLAYGCVYLIV